MSNRTNILNVTIKMILRISGEKKNRYNIPRGLPPTYNQVSDELVHSATEPTY